MKKIIPVLLIAVSAALWGMIAIFVKKLANAGLTSMEIVTVRVITAAILLGIWGVVQYRPLLKIKFGDIRLFVGTGICSIVLFNWCYFTSINQLSLSLAVILLYTAPAFVTILSFLFLKETIDFRKMISVIGTVLGCVLIAGFNLNESSSISFMGILTGMGAGFGYALYSIFGKFALEKYPPFTVTLYTFLVASVVLFPLTGIWKKADIFMNGEVLIYGIGLGLFPTVIAYLLYTKGLEKIESSKAAIIATVEPVVATILGVFLYDESFGTVQLIGTAFILGSVIFVNINIHLKTAKEKASI